MTFFISLVKFIHSIGEKTEGGTDKDASGFSLFQLGGNLDHTVSGGDHIIDDDHILAFYIGTQELMSDDRVLYRLRYGHSHDVCRTYPYPR